MLVSFNVLENGIELTVLAKNSWDGSAYTVLVPLNAEVCLGVATKEIIAIGTGQIDIQPLAGDVEVLNIQEVLRTGQGVSGQIYDPNLNDGLGPINFFLEPDGLKAGNVNLGYENVSVPCMAIDVANWTSDQISWVKDFFSTPKVHFLADSKVHDKCDPEGKIVQLLITGVPETYALDLKNFLEKKLFVPRAVDRLLQAFDLSDSSGKVQLCGQPDQEFIEEVKKVFLSLPANILKIAKLLGLRIVLARNLGEFALIERGSQNINNVSGNENIDKGDLRTHWDEFPGIHIVMSRTIGIGQYTLRPGVDPQQALALTAENLTPNSDLLWWKKSDNKMIKAIIYHEMSHFLSSVCWHPEDPFVKLSGMSFKDAYMADIARMGGVDSAQKIKALKYFVRLPPFSERGTEEVFAESLAAALDCVDHPEMRYSELMPHKLEVFFPYAFAWARDFVAGILNCDTSVDLANYIYENATIKILTPPDPILRDGDVLDCIVVKKNNSVILKTIDLAIRDEPLEKAKKRHQALFSRIKCFAPSAEEKYLNEGLIAGIALPYSQWLKLPGNFQLDASDERVISEERKRRINGLVPCFPESLCVTSTKITVYDATIDLTGVDSNLCTNIMKSMQDALAKQPGNVLSTRMSLPVSVGGQRYTVGGVVDRDGFASVLKNVLKDNGLSDLPGPVRRPGGANLIGYGL